MEKEIWKPIRGYEGLYEVSSFGRVRRTDGRFVKQQIINSGYFTVRLKSKTLLVHRLVCTAFVENIQNKPCVNHLDCNKLNNKASNLTWCTHSENNSWANHSLLQSISHIERLHKNKLSKKIIQIDKNNNIVNSFLSMRDAERKLGIDHSAICRCCKGEMKSTHGYTFKYAE